LIVSRRQVLGTLGVLGASAAIGRVAWTRRIDPAAPPAEGCAGLAGQQIRWIVPHAAGGGYDAESRLIEPFLERRLGAQIVVQNMPGASGVTGARAIVSAPADGRTIGIVGAPGLLVAKLTGSSDFLDPAAFTILARVSRSWHVWATGRNSPLKSLDDALTAARKRPLVFALSEVGSVNFLSAGVTASVLQIPVTMVPGFQGSQASALAAVRGDVDLVSFDFEAMRTFIESGELRPLLQVSDRPVESHDSLNGVPVLGGPEGWVATHASDDGAMPSTRALIEVVSAGRIIVAPPTLDVNLASCLDRALNETLLSAELKASARRGMDVATGEQARADIAAASRDVPLLQQPLKDALGAIRG
jgi:hypothetical protein